MDSSHKYPCSIMKIFLLFSVFRMTLTNELDFDTNPRGNANKLVDEILKKTLNNFGDELEPCVLPDLRFFFKRKIFFVNYGGEANFNEGKLYGLRNLYRGGDCTMVLSEEKLGLTADLSVNNLNLEYLGRISFMGLNSRYEISGRVGVISAKLSLEARQENELIVTEFDIYQLNGVEFQVKNHRALNPILKFLTKIIMRFFKTKIENIMEKHLKKLINDEIKSVNVADVLVQNLA